MRGQIQTPGNVYFGFDGAPKVSAEALAREFDSAPTVGDRLRLGKVELIVRDVGNDGRVAEVGLALKP